MSKEIWKVIEECDSYSVSNTGKVKNNITKQALKPKIDRYGYEVVSLSRGSKPKLWRTIHRLVAKAFIPNDDNKNQVNHIDGNKRNNHVMNLEWSTPKENINHSYDSGLNCNLNRVTLLDKTTGERKEFRSVKQLGKFLGMHSSNLISMIKHSDINPILGKFVIKVDDPTSMFSKPNVKNFGVTIFVLDQLTSEILEFPSINLCQYELGIRSFSHMDLNYSFHLKSIGYVVSKLRKYLEHINFDIIPKDEIISNRKNMIMKPYTKNATGYEVYDFRNNKLYSFDKSSDIVDFINNKSVIKTNGQSLHVAVSRSARINQVALYRGYGIRKKDTDIEWPLDITEERLICSELNFPSITKGFRLVNLTTGYSEVILGEFNLLKRFNLGRLPIEHIGKEEQYINSLLPPTFRVERLNKPVIKS